MPIPTYIINLAKRTDRKAHVLNEFDGRKAFLPVLTNAIEHETGAFGLWKTLIKVIKQQEKNDRDYIILCEDDHMFSADYTDEILYRSIKQADALGADILCGGVSWFSNGLGISPELIWVERFSGLQFTVIFRRFFKKLLCAHFSDGDAADTKISQLTKNKYCMFPFTSVQKDFGYSDVTVRNNYVGRVGQLFVNSRIKAGAVSYITNHYKRTKYKVSHHLFFSQKPIPLLVLNREDKTDNREVVARHFSQQKEFEVNVDFFKDFNTRNEQWRAIQTAIKNAESQSAEMVVLCWDDYVFSSDYTPKALMQSIRSAYQVGAEILCCGLTNFDIAIPIHPGQIWLSSFSNPGVLVIFKSLFHKLENLSLDREMSVELLLSRSTSYKTLGFPLLFNHNEAVIKDQIAHADKTFFSAEDYRDPELRIKLVQQISDLVATVDLNETAHLDKQAL
ncbi:hypothetical protein [uncultured Pedobacter sp.]|uniref:hypothetical protein n=1 Tax=uncultured Pedobacter sp. TaxID=246139 RepID=UPI0025FB232E|nr:hypothetical protein [uncultured Pedobacter sp.]